MKSSCFAYEFLIISRKMDKFDVFAEVQMNKKNAERTAFENKSLILRLEKSRDYLKKTS